MASIKVTTQNQERTQKVAAKGKSIMSVGGSTRGSLSQKNAGFGNYKVYMEKEKVKVDAANRRRSVPVNKEGILVTESVSKGASRNMENGEKKGDSLDDKKAGRKALVDVSNIVGNFPKNALVGGRKTMVSTGQSAKNLIASKKTARENMRRGVNQKAIEFTIRKMGIQHSEVSSLYQKTKTKIAAAGPSDSKGRAPKNKAKADRCEAVRKSSKPIASTTLITTLKTTNSRTSKLMCTSGPKKSMPPAPTSSKNKDEAKSSLHQNTVQVASQEVNQGKLSSDLETLENTKKTSLRRRSFTSFLMTRSKIADDHSKDIKQEKLPNIDDNCSHLEVAEYIDEIYQYYWIKEAENPSLENYFSIQTEITPHMRGILVNWLVEVHFKFDLMPETLYLMIALLDQYLSLVTIKKNEMQLVGLAALLLASKYEDFWHPRVQDLLSISAESFTTSQLLTMEKLILNKIKFRLNGPTPYVFMLRFLKAAQSNTKLEQLAFYLLELCLVEYEALKFKPSMLSASAIFVARCTLGISPSWTPLLVKHSRYEASKIKDCAEMILKFHKSAGTRQLCVTYNKYSSGDLSRVAKVKPLDRLVS